MLVYLQERWLVEMLKAAGQSYVHKQSIILHLFHITGLQCVQKARWYGYIYIYLPGTQALKSRHP